MAESSYPAALDAFITHRDNVKETIAAAHANDIQSAVVKIQSTLGVNPQGTSATVKDRLAAMDAAISSAASAAGYSPPVASSTTRGIVKLAGDFSGTADLPRLTQLPNLATINYVDSFARVKDLGSVSGTVTLDLGQASAFAMTATGAVAIAVSNWPTKVLLTEITVWIKQDPTGGRTITWPTRFATNNTVGLASNSANSVTVYQFSSMDVGNTVYLTAAPSFTPATIPVETDRFDSSVTALSNLRYYMPMEETSGTAVTDASTAGHSSVYSGTVTLNSVTTVPTSTKKAPAFSAAGTSYVAQDAVRLCAATASTPIPTGTSWPLKVHSSGRYLEDQAGKAFLYCADTAWVTVSRLSVANAKRYIDIKASQGFNTIQASLTVWNRTEFGDRGAPFVNGVMTQPNLAYWTGVDEIIDYAASKGMLCSLLPIWGANNGSWAGGSSPSNTEFANYCTWLGTRYTGKGNIVWALGGDEQYNNDPDITGRPSMWDAGAAALEAADPNHLITYHPRWDNYTELAAKTWVDYNSIQHNDNNTPYTYTLAATGYAESPTRPFLNSEPPYVPGTAGSTDVDTSLLRNRQNGWWSILAGAMGVVYGGQRSGTWNIGDGGVYNWDATADVSGKHTGNIRKVLEQYHWEELVPDTGASIVTSSRGSGLTWIPVGRAADGSLIVIYLPNGGNVTVALTQMAGAGTAYYYDPSTGQVAGTPATFTNSGTQVYSPPSSTNAAGEPDWVLILTTDAGRASSVSSPPSAWSLGFTLNASDPGTSARSTIYSETLSTDSTTNQGFFIEASATALAGGKTATDIRLTSASGTNQMVKTLSKAIWDGSPHFIVVNFNGTSTWSVYVDGVLSDTWTQVVTAVAVDRATWGARRRATTDRYFTGGIGRIWARGAQTTAAEVTAMRAAWTSGGNPTPDPDPQTSFDSNGVKLGIPTVTVNNSQITASAVIERDRTVDFKYLQIAVRPPAGSGGTAFSMAYTPGLQTGAGTQTITDTATCDVNGTWTAFATYSLVTSPVQADWKDGVPVQFTVGTVAPPDPGTGGGGTVLLGASMAGRGVADGSLDAWIGRPVDIAGSWNDTSPSVSQEQWSVQPGSDYGSWTKYHDIGIGAIYPSSGESWGSAAGGAYDSRFRALLNNIKSGMGSRDTSKLFLRFAVEFNIPDMPWEVNGADAANFVATWKRFRALQKEILPLANLVWCPNDGTNSGLNLTLSNAFPGVSYVDVYGFDTYNKWPFQSNPTQSEFDDWMNAVDGRGNPTGPEAHRQRALALGLPVGIGEWGSSGVNDDGGGGGDSPGWINKMFDWIFAHQGTGPGQIKYAVFFNQWSKYILWPTTSQPNARDAWKTRMLNRS